jgi:hypothetical protein
MGSSGDELDVRHLQDIANIFVTPIVTTHPQDIANIFVTPMVTSHLQDIANIFVAPAVTAETMYKPMPTVCKAFCVYFSTWHCWSLLTIFSSAIQNRKCSQKVLNLKQVSVILYPQKAPAEEFEVQADSTIEPGDAWSSGDFGPFQSDWNIRSQRLWHRLEEPLVNCMVPNIAAARTQMRAASRPI